MFIAFIIFFSFSLCMLMAAFKDASVMLIPNWICLTVFALFLLITPFAWTDMSIFGEHLMVGSTVFAVGFVMFALGWLGGGDAKLLAATSFWWTWTDLVNYIGFVGIIGGALALFILLGRQYMPARIATSAWSYGLFKEEKKMPYGLALAAGALLTLPDSHIFMTAIGF
jgi:prepilin peptidase CpaA